MCIYIYRERERKMKMCANLKLCASVVSFVKKLIFLSYNLLTLIVKMCERTLYD